MTTHDIYGGSPYVEGGSPDVFADLNSDISGGYAITGGGLVQDWKAGKRLSIYVRIISIIVIFIMLVILVSSYTSDKTVLGLSATALTFFLLYHIIDLWPNDTVKALETTINAYENAPNVYDWWKEKKRKGKSSNDIGYVTQHNYPQNRGNNNAHGAPY